jgi:hypothetical protein
MKLSKTFWFIFWLLTGLIVGGLLANLCTGIDWLSWLAYGDSISFSPAADLVILKFSLELTFQLNLAEVVCVLGAMLCYHHLEG